MSSLKIYLNHGLVDLKKKTEEKVKTRFGIKCSNRHENANQKKHEVQRRRGYNLVTYLRQINREFYLNEVQFVSYEHHTFSLICQNLPTTPFLSVMWFEQPEPDFEFELLFAATHLSICFSLSTVSSSSFLRPDA